MNRFIEKYKELIGVGILALVLILYAANKQKDIEKNGVYVVVRFERYEAHADGGLFYFTVFFKNDSVPTTYGVNPKVDLKKSHYYFAKVKRNDPYKDAVVYSEKEVPPCILKEKIPEWGWDQLPLCVDKQ